MRLLEKLNIFKKREESTTETTENVSNYISDGLLRALINDTPITKEQALSLPIVSSAVDLISNIIAMLPIYLYKEDATDEGKKQIEQINNDNRVFLLNNETGDTLDSFQLKKAMIQDYLLDKGGYAFIKKQGTKYISIHYVDARYIGYKKNTDPIFKDGQYLIMGRPYELYDFIALLRNTKDGITGIGVIEEVSKAIETAYQNILFELNIVKKGGVKKGFLTAEKKLGEAEMETLRNSWKRLYSDNSENVMVLNNGTKFQEASSTGVELQLNERKKTLNEEINTIFHIHDDYSLFIKEAIMPIIKAFETALNRNFLLEEEKEHLYFAFDTREITKGDIKARYEAYKLAHDTGFITNNEIRYFEDMDQIDGLDTISFNLAQVIYDTKTKQYYVPNTGSVFSTLDDAIKNTKGGEESNENTNQE